MQDEFSSLVPVTLMMQLRSLKIESARNIIEKRNQPNKQEPVSESEESDQEEETKS